MDKRWVRVLQAAVGLPIVVLAVRSLVRNWDQLQAQPLDWQLQPIWLALSVLVVWLMYALLIFAWRGMLAGWGQQLDGWSAARIWTISSLGKYLPGKVWAVAGMALLAQRAGVPVWAATGSALVLQLLAVGTGAVVAGVAGAYVLESAYPGARLLLGLLLMAAILGLGLLLWPRFLQWVLRRTAPGAGGRSPGVGTVLLGVIANSVAWVGYGLALWLLALGFLPASGLDLRLAIAVFTTSYLAGFLALLAPGGIGVREGVFILLLQGPLGLPTATALAVASRLLLTITELGAAVPFVAFPRRSARAPS